MNDPDDAPGATMVDLAFAIEGDRLPRDHRALLAAALEAALPWLAGTPGAGVHRLNVVTMTAAGGTQALLSRRTKLVLRVPRERAADTGALVGATLDLGGHALHVGAQHARELLPWGTLYAHTVLARADDDEPSFLCSVRDELDRLGVGGRIICGRRHDLDDEGLNGFGLMVDQLQAPDALRVMEHGLGERRALGCGIFVPHKSAAAVGAMP